MSAIKLAVPRPDPLKKTAEELKLGGLYEVIHGAIVFAKDRVAIVGDIIELDDVDAALICQHLNKDGVMTLVKRVSAAYLEQKAKTLAEDLEESAEAARKSQAKSERKRRLDATA